MSKQTLVFNDIEVNKKDFYTSKQASPLHLVHIINRVISYRVKPPINILLFIYKMMM